MPPTPQAGDGPQVEAAAAGLAEGLRQRGVLRAFGAAASVPKRAYTLEELRLNKIQPEQFLAPTDTTLSGVRNVLQARGAAGRRRRAGHLLVWWWRRRPSPAGGVSAALDACA